jgi:serine/threonine-protein kinase
VFAWLNRPAPASPADVVRAELASMACSWLRITDRSSVDGVEVFKLSGASVVPPDKIARTILAAARRQDADVDQVIATDVAPLYASQCGWIDKLQGYRYAGVPRFRVATKPMGQGVTRADLTVGAAGLGAAGAVYGIDPSGAVERIVDRDQLEALKVPRTPEGDYVLSLDIDHVGWNGVVFMESATPVPKGVVEDPVQTDAERREFERLAQAGRWRFELAWFKVGN